MRGYRPVMSGNRYNKKTQDWSVGEMVNVGFLRLRVIEVCGEAHRSYKLSSPDLSKMYAFSPYDGLHRVYEGE